MMWLMVEFRAFVWVLSGWCFACCGDLPIHFREELSINAYSKIEMLWGVQYAISHDFFKYNT